MRVILYFLIIVSFSCKEDVSPPGITDFAINGSSDTLHLNLDTANQYFLSALIQDDKKIDQIRTYSQSVLTGTPSDSSLFSNFNSSYYLGVGANYHQVNDSIIIQPYSTTGLYLLSISAVDNSGNEGYGDTVYTWLYSSSAPYQNISFPDFSNNTPMFFPGDTIKIQGTVEDDVAVKNINSGIYTTEYSAISTQNFTVSDTVITSWDFEANNSQLFIPTSITSGIYLFSISMEDNDGNLTEFMDSIIIN